MAKQIRCAENEKRWSNFFFSQPHCPSENLKSQKRDKMMCFYAFGVFVKQTDFQCPMRMYSVLHLFFYWISSALDSPSYVRLKWTNRAKWALAWRKKNGRINNFCVYVYLICEMALLLTLFDVNKMDQRSWKSLHRSFNLSFIVIL